MSLYSVILWGCKPGTDDLAYTGADFDTLEAAMQCFNNPFDTFHGPGGKSGEVYYLGSECWIELDGQVDPATGDNMMRQLSNASKAPDSEADWRREIANEAGMLHGVDAYNEAMGWD